MRHRTTTALLALTLALSACQGGDTAETTIAVETTTTTAPPTTTTTTTEAPATTAPLSARSASVPSGSVEAPMASLLSYRYQPDSTLAYALDLSQTIRMTADGDAEAMGEDELPIDADLALGAATVMTYEVYPGPSPDTYEVVITAQFDDVSVSGTMNGEPVDELSGDDIASEIATLEPIETSVIVDAAGNIISGDGSELDFFGDSFGAVGGLATDELGRPIGPSFPTDRELTVGDTWTETTSEEGPNGEVFTSTTTHTVIDAQTIGDATTLVIESVTETDAVDIDFSEFFRMMFEGFAGLGGEEGGDLPPEMEEMLDQLEFSISIAPSTAVATTWFDPESGIVRRSEAISTVAIQMTFRAPDETTGELVGFEMQMEMEQTVTIALLDGEA
jgi:hypothetical protein